MNMRLSTKLAIGAVAAVLLASTATASASSGPLTWCHDKTSLAVLGDSGSTGAGVSHAENRWTNVVQGIFGTATVTNYSHDGAMVSDYLPGGRWTQTTGATADLVGRKPSLVMIELGANEYYNQVDPNVYATNLATLISNVRAASPTSTVVLVHSWLIGTTVAPHLYEWSSWEQVMTQAAISGGYGLVLWTQTMPPVVTDTAGLYYFFSPSDHVGHPNDAGNRVEAAQTAMLLACYN